MVVFWRLSGMCAYRRIEWQKSGNQDFAKFESGAQFLGLSPTLTVDVAENYPVAAG